ncbi:MAG TPA: hypothetical protein VNJ08_10180 [Bacteriovoracaceae bacterium]|nr:hypothetical protein [Bacteriovoracaceae bacterium]
MKHLLISTLILSLTANVFGGTTVTPTEGGAIKKTTEFRIDKEKTEEAREEEQEKLDERREEQFKQEEKQLKDAQKQQEERLEDIQKEEKEILKENQEDLTERQKEEEAQKQVKEVRGTYKVRTEKVKPATPQQPGSPVQ